MASPKAQPSPTPLTVEQRPNPAREPSPTLAPAATPTPLPSGPPDQTLLALGELVDEEGRLPVQTAMEIFAAYVAPLPGVTPRQLPGENPSPAVEVAVRVLVSDLDALPPEIATAVEQAIFGGVEEWLEIPPSGSQSTLDRLLGALALALSPPPVRAQDDSPDLEGLRAVVEETRDRVEARSAIRLRLPIRVGLNPRLPPDVGAEAFGQTVRGRLGACRIVFNPAFLGDPSVVEFLAAHEVWHCMQFDYAGWPLDGRLWLSEGQAAWVGAEVATPAPFFTTGWWDTWLGAPDQSLCGAVVTMRSGSTRRRRRPVTTRSA